MEKKHTPGPWQLKVAEFGGPHEVSFAPKSYGRIASVFTPGFQNLPEAPTTQECEANARLIAAAPDLLAACEMLAEAYQSGEDNAGSMEWSDVDLAWEYATAAIAKALGEDACPPAADTE